MAVAFGLVRSFDLLDWLERRICSGFIVIFIHRGNSSTCAQKNFSLNSLFFFSFFFFRCVALNSNTVRLLCRIAQARRTLMMPMSLVLQTLPPRVSLRRLPREMARGRYAPLHDHRHRWRRRRSKPSRPRSRRSSSEQTDIGGGYKRIAGFMPPEARLRGAPT